jgi:hypothetical protein
LDIPDVGFFKGSEGAPLVQEEVKVGFELGGRLRGRVEDCQFDVLACRCLPLLLDSNGFCLCTGTHAEVVFHFCAVVAVVLSFKNHLVVDRTGLVELFRGRYLLSIL